MQNLLIREAQEDDLRVLQVFLPSDIPDFHKEVLLEFKQQKETWILAISNNYQVGHVRIRWEGSRNKQVKEIFANIPNLEVLGVKEEFRLQGIGSLLLAAAEKKIKRRGFNNSALVVEHRNEELKQYYAKRGYVNWNKGVFTSEWEERDVNGAIIQRTEEYTYMFKTLW